MTSIPQPVPSAQDSPAQVVLGVDTHRDIHVAAVASALGVLLDSKSFPTTAVGYRRLLAWAMRLRP